MLQMFSKTMLNTGTHTHTYVANIFYLMVVYIWVSLNRDYNSYLCVAVYCVTLIMGGTWTNIWLCSPDRELTTGRTNDTTNVQLGKRVSVLGLFTGVWVRVSLQGHGWFNSSRSLKLHLNMGDPCRPKPGALCTLCQQLYRPQSVSSEVLFVYLWAKWSLWIW